MNIDLPYNTGNGFIYRDNLKIDKDEHEEQMTYMMRNIKSVRNLGFIPIKTKDNCPLPEDIDFKTNIINIYISLGNIDLNPKEGDIRILINNLSEMQIVEIQRYSQGNFVLYIEFNDLYLERSPEKYTVKELNTFALEDNAPFKRKFLCL